MTEAGHHVSELPERLQQLIAEGRVTPAKYRGRPLQPVSPVASDWTLEEFLADRDDD